MSGRVDHLKTWCMHVSSVADSSRELRNETPVLWCNKICFHNHPKGLDRLFSDVYSSCFNSCQDILDEKRIYVAHLPGTARNVSLTTFSWFDLLQTQQVAWTWGPRACNFCNPRWKVYIKLSEKTPCRGSWRCPLNCDDVLFQLYNSLPPTQLRATAFLSSCWWLTFMRFWNRHTKDGDEITERPEPFSFWKLRWGSRLLKTSSRGASLYIWGDCVVGCCVCTYNHHMPLNISKGGLAHRPTCNHETPRDNLS